MVKYVTKEEIGQEVRKIFTTPSYSWNDSFLPLLAFDNETRTVKCENCGHPESKIKFQHNLSAAARSDKVVYDWNVDLEQVYVTGYFCKECKITEINVHEKNPENSGETVYKNT